MLGYETKASVSTDDFAGWLALQTNLALKGIVGINAMSKLSEIAGYNQNASYFKVCCSLEGKWRQLISEEYLRYLHCQVGNVRNVSGQYAREGCL